MLNMKKYVTIILCLCLIVLSGCSAKYKSLTFDSDTLDEALDKNLTEDTKVLYEAKESFAEKLPIYKITERKIRKNEFNDMLEALGLEEYAHCFELDGNQITGTIANYTDTSRGFFDMSEEELEALAWETFNKIPFIEGTYEYLGMKASYTLNDSNGDHITRAGATFKRVLDGVSVRGNDRFYLYFDGTGLVEIVIELYNYEKIKEIDLVSFQSAKERIKTPDYLSLNTGVEIDTLKVEKAQLLYYNQYRLDNKVLQPVYVFKGIATDVNGEKIDFSSKIKAMPEELTYTETD